MSLSYRLSYQSVIGKRLVLDGPAGQIVEELVFVPASVEAVDEFLEIAIEMFVTDAVEGPDQPSLDADARTREHVPTCAGVGRVAKGFLYDSIGCQMIQLKWRALRAGNPVEEFLAGTEELLLGVFERADSIDNR
jgi:hypothetical protein